MLVKRRRNRVKIWQKVNRPADVKLTFFIFVMMSLFTVAFLLFVSLLVIALFVSLLERTAFLVTMLLMEAALLLVKGLVMVLIEELLLLAVVIALVDLMMAPAMEKRDAFLLRD